MLRAVYNGLMIVLSQNRLPEIKANVAYDKEIIVILSNDDVGALVSVYS